MAEERQEPSIILGEKKGLPVYRVNPSIPEPESISKKKRIQFGNEKRGFVIEKDTGELVSVGGAGFYEFEEVDDTRFVKLFLAGLKQATGLSKSGLAIFELVYKQLQNSPNVDEVKLSFLEASEQIEGLAERTFQRGLRELLDKEFLYLTPYSGLFFVNIRYMFNGDRLAFVKGYKRKSSSNKENQLDMFEQKALEAKEAEAE